MALMAVSRYDETNKDVFVSYGREDEVKKFVRKLKKDLEDAQLSVWLDEEDIPAGTERPLAIGIALRECKALIAVLTKKYVSSRFCKSELYFACTNQKPIFPVVREEGWDVSVDEECEGVKYMTAASNWVTFLPTDDYSAAVQSLVAGLKGSIGRPLLRPVHDVKKQDLLTGQPPTPNIEPPNWSWSQPTPPTEHLGGHEPISAAPKVSSIPMDNTEQQKLENMSPQCCQFVRLIDKLRTILSSDPESEALMLCHMKISLESICIEPEVYQDTQTAAEFFTVMSKYWNCYDDHDLLKMVIESTENEEAISVLNNFLRSRDCGIIIPTEKCPRSPFQSPCHGSSSNSKANVMKTDASTEKAWKLLKNLQHFHHHPGCSNELPPNRVPVVAEVDYNFLTGFMYDCLKNVIATITKAPKPAMSLFEAYKEPCTLVWHVSKETAAEIEKSQLSQDDKETLLACKVLKLSYGDKCLFKVAKEELQEMVTSGIIQEELEVAEGGEMVAESQGRVRIITSDGEFERELREAGETLVVMDFTADWCGWSVIMDPIFAVLSEEFTEAEFLQVDSEECRGAVVKYSVNAYPTFAFFRKAKLLDKFSGANSKRLVMTIKHFPGKGHSLGTKDDPDTAGTSSSPSSSTTSSPPPTSPPVKEKLTSGEERVREGQKQSGRRVKEERRSVGEERRRSQEPESKGGVWTITSDEEFEHELTRAGKTLVVVDFTSVRCPWSELIDPVFEVLSERYTAARFLLVDADKCKGAVTKCDVDAVPMFVFFRKKKVLYQFSGANPEQLVAAIKYFLQGRGAEKGLSEEEEERQIGGEEAVRETIRDRRSAGEEEGGDEGAVGGGDREESEEQPIPPDPVTVDPSLPTTTVQIRLADGSRLTEKFNHTHTIGDLYRHISYSRPDLAAASYVLMTTYPRRELTDDTQTLADANLLNSLIIQRKGLTSEHIDIKRHLDALELAIRRKGSLDKIIMQCVFVGPPRSGKSSLMKRMVGERPTPSSPSTGVANKVVQIVVRPSTAKTQSSSEWVKLSHEDETVMVVMDTTQSHLCPVVHDETQLQASVPVSPVHLTEPSTRILDSSAGKYTKQPQHQAKLSKFRSTDAADLKVPIEFCRSALQTNLCNVRKILREQGWLVYLTDTGGQIEFQELLPLLASGPSVFFLVFRLDEDLNKRFTVKYVHPNGTTSEPYQSTFTVKEALLQSLASIASMVTCNFRGEQVSLKSQVFFVGTHKDKVSKAEIDCIDYALQQWIKPTGLYRKGMIQFASESHMLLAVNNLSDDDSGIQQVREAVERLGSQGGFKVTAPPSWLIFSLIIRQQKDRVLSYEQCFDLASRCGITKQEELNHALWFLHTKVGLIRYFQGEGLEDLQKIVIQDPQVLFDRITDLVVETFTFNKADPVVRDDFKEKGIFPFSTFQRISGGSDHLLTPFRFVKLLEHLHIIAPLEEEAEKKYFMPCVLAHAQPAKAISGVSGEQSAEHSFNNSSLLIYFKCGYCPKGLFGALVVYLLANTKWRLQRNGIFKDQISFSRDPYDMVSITVQPKFFEITCTHTSSVSIDNRCFPLAVTCKEVRHYIETGIREVALALCYTIDTAYCLAFYCPENHPSSDLTEPHPAEIIFHNEKPCTLRCELAEGTLQLPHGYERWFTEASEGQQKEKHSLEETGSGSGTNSTIGNTTQTASIPGLAQQGSDADKELSRSDMVDISAYLDKMENAKILKLGVALGLDYVKLKNNMNSDMFLFDTIHAWLQKEDDVMKRGNPTWKALINALNSKGVGQTGIATEIAKDKGVCIK